MFESQHEIWPQGKGRRITLLGSRIHPRTQVAVAEAEPECVIGGGDLSELFQQPRGCSILVLFGLFVCQRAQFNCPARACLHLLQHLLRFLLATGRYQ